MFNSAKAVFFAPSDQSGVGGMRREIIRATPSWRGGPGRYDCVYVANGGMDTDGFRSLLVARVRLFFSSAYNGRDYSCALVDWFLPVAGEVDELTGMWIVAPEIDNHGRHIQSVISLDSIIQSAHLIGVYGRDLVPTNFHFSETFDAFRAYYVNKYIDHHAHTLVF